MTGVDPATLWKYYMRLTDIEQAFKELKHDRAIRPIFHQREERIEAHIFVSFLAYCLLVTLNNLARRRAPGLTLRAIFEKFSIIAAWSTLHLPTTDGLRLVLARHTPGEPGPRTAPTPAWAEVAGAGGTTAIGLKSRFRTLSIHCPVVSTFRWSATENQ